MTILIGQVITLFPLEVALESGGQSRVMHTAVPVPALRIGTKVICDLRIGEVGPSRVIVLGVVGGGAPPPGRAWSWGAPTGYGPVSTPNGATVVPPGATSSIPIQLVAGVTYRMHSAFQIQGPSTPTGRAYVRLLMNPGGTILQRGYVTATTATNDENRPLVSVERVWRQTTDEEVTPTTEIEAQTTGMSLLSTNSVPYSSVAPLGYGVIS